MKKIILISMIMAITVILVSETVELKSGKRLKGEIVGKMEDYLYLQADHLYKIAEEDVLSITNNANLPITKVFLRKKDFLNVNLKDHKIEEIVGNEIPLKKYDFMTKKLDEVDIEKMTEREFELYLNEMKVQEINGVRKTMWKIWTTSFLVGAASSIIIILAAG